jgi:1-acyl-sn-glycerol-3-phosphate acyltransferase
MTAAGMRRFLWRTVFWCAGGIEVHGALPAGGCVVVANHCSHADAPAILAALDAAHRPLVAAAADYWFTGPVNARICRWLVAGFPVRRGGGGYADLAAKHAELQRARAVVVFPAGSRRSVDGPFRTGAFQLAHDAGVPVVGVRLQGTAHLLAPGGRLRRGRVIVEILPGEPVTDPRRAAVDLQARLAVPRRVAGRSVPPAVGHGDDAVAERARVDNREAQVGHAVEQRHPGAHDDRHDVEVQFVE